MQGTQIDPNTGFLDRYSCLQLASDMVEEVGESGQSLDVLWIDLDHFKHINESFGYDGGDSVISLVADRLRETVNGKAEIGRVGADEFVCLVRDVDIDHAEKLGIELMRAIDPP